MIKLPANYYWPNLSTIRRQYIVRDDRGRYGVGRIDARDTDIIWAWPVEMSDVMTAPSEMGLPTNAVLMTATSWHHKPDGTYTGWWCDDDLQPPECIRRLEIVYDLGYLIPDWVADQALAGSDQPGHWDYGAKLGRIGGEPPVKGQKANEITIGETLEYACEIGERLTARGLRLSARRGFIPGARKAGRDWLLTYEGINYYFDNRPKCGRRSGSGQKIT
jgi:hypothetical protein